MRTSIVKNDDIPYRFAFGFFIISLFFTIVFFYLGSYLNTAKGPKNMCSACYGFLILFFGIIPLFAEAAAIRTLVNLDDREMLVLCVGSNSGNPDYKLPEYLDSKYTRMIYKFA